MEGRVLGKSGIEVSPLGMGCMGLTHASGDLMPDAGAERVVREAYEMGYTFFDTAECYVGMRSDGTEAYNEDVVGAALAPVRDSVVIASKFGVQHAADRTLVMDSSPASIRKSAEGSIRRLQADHIDLCCQHRIDPKVEPEAVASTMADLMKEGKIRAWGISEANEEYLCHADAVCPVAAVENRHSIMAGWHEPLFPVLEELDVALVAFSPLTNGFLTGAYSSKTKFEGAQDYRLGMPQYTEEGERRARPLVELIAQLAEKHHAADAQISLAWMLCKKPWIVPIPGSRKPERLRQFNGTDNPEEQHKIAEELLGDMGARAVLMAPFRCTYGVHISLGDDVLVNMNRTFLDSNLITIGDRTLIAPDVKICCGEHNMDASKRFGTRADGTRYLITTARPVTIGKDCCIGGNATVLPGVTIGDNAVVAAGAVVTKDLPSNTVCGGVPARVLREL